ncbi:MAG: PilZ domain-containing protein [Candidatus Omnitrophica bacterium]|nr:PilZ domain-containing protein [Candidatus Omnitrophota bacterium]
MARERRGFARLYVGVEAVYKQAEKENTVLVQDVSISGVRFISNEVLDQNIEVAFTLSIPDLPKIITAKGKVIWQRKFSESFCDTGLEFTQIDEDSHQMLLKYIKGALSRVNEHREFVRSNLSAMVTYRLAAAPEVEKRCISIDVSPSGMKVFSRELLKNEDDLDLFFNLPDIDEEIHAKGKVIWTKEKEENFSECGIEFTQINDESIDKINCYVKQTLGIEW